ncbi:hypothetical protein IFM89_007992 [Coptis chinensis]|uniref:Uncharacterized protein n=1 Tax=Coptis chinensis TaxID=261450 RepID=A0A835IKY3_9MAGN|nr:hypothetical protein IFM89_007992 [Coptis chinensis]
MDHSKIGPARRKQVVQELPSLDKFLVKHMSKLEIEVQEAKNRRKNHAQGGSVEENLEGSESRLDSMSSNVTTSEAVPDLGNVLLKHVSKLEKEIEVAKKTSGREFEMKSKQLGKTQRDVSGLPSLDKFLVKHVSRLEREVQEAKNSRKNDLIERKSKPNSDSTAVSSPAVADLHDTGDSSSEVGKENIGPNKQVNDALCGTIREVVEKMHPENHGSTTFSIEHNSSDWSEKSSVTIRPMSRIERAKLETMKAFSFQDGNARSESESSLDKILVKPVHRLEKEKKQALALGMGYGNLSNKLRHEYTNNGSHCDSLDKVLVKHVSRLEKEKMERSSKEEVKELRDTDSTKNCTDSLDQILVKHQSQLEKEKLGLVKQPVDEIKHSKTRREARERELQEAWGGLSLGSSVRPHLSRLERDKAAWTKAEEEARIRARREMET